MSWFGNIVFIIIIIAIGGAVVGFITEVVIWPIQEKKQKKKNNDLMNAVNKGDRKTAQTLIESGASINYVGLFNYKNRSMLQIAVENHDKEMVLFLINRGANVNLNNKDKSVLQIAVENNSKEIVSLLLEKGANVNYVYDGKVALDFTRDDEIIAILKNHGAKTKAEIDEAARESAEQAKKQYMMNEDLLTAIQKHDRDRVESLISQGADVNYATSQGNTPLTFAVSGNDLEIIKLLLKNGADPRKENYVPSGGAINAINFAKYVARNEYIANFLEYA